MNMLTTWYVVCMYVCDREKSFSFNKSFWENCLTLCSNFVHVKVSFVNFSFFSLSVPIPVAHNKLGHQFMWKKKFAKVKMEDNGFNGIAQLMPSSSLSSSSTGSEQSEKVQCEHRHIYRNWEPNCYLMISHVAPWLAILFFCSYKIYILKTLFGLMKFGWNGRQNGNICDEFFGAH